MCQDYLAIHYTQATFSHVLSTFSTPIKYVQKINKFNKDLYMYMCHQLPRHWTCPLTITCLAINIETVSIITRAKERANTIVAILITPININCTLILICM